MDYIIMTDSDSELDFIQMKDSGVPMLLMPYTHKGKEYAYAPSYAASHKEYYEDLRTGEVPTTAGRNAYDFLEIWEPYLAESKDILYIGLTSSLSNTYDNAVLAREEALSKYPDRRIVLVDSLRISFAQGILVLRALEMKAAGATLDEVSRWAEKDKLKARAYFTVDDLNFLKRGGRLSGSAAFLGIILEVKPMLEISDDGKLVPIDKVKGRKKAIARMLDNIEKEMEPGDENIFAICHGDCLSDAQAVETVLRERFGAKRVIVSAVGPVIGCHVGPGTLGICYFRR